MENTRGFGKVKAVAQSLAPRKTGSINLRSSVARKKRAGHDAPPADSIGCPDYPLRQRPRRLLEQHEVAQQSLLLQVPQPLVQVLQPLLQPLLQQVLHGTCFCT